MGIAERKERQRKEVHDSILDAAWNVVTQEGWQSLSIRKIADAIEYSAPVVYDHFENKEAILSEFNKRGFKLLGDKIGEAKGKYDVPAQQLEAIAFAYWDFAFSEKEYYQLMFGLGMPTCESLTSVPELTAFISVFYSTIEQLANDEGLDANIWMKVHSFWSMLHGLVSINLMTAPVSHMGLTPQEMNKMILNDFVCGFLKGMKP